MWEALAQYDASDWKASIEPEVDSLPQHQTWSTVDFTEWVKTLSTRFVIIHKYKELCMLICYKARLLFETIYRVMWSRM